MCICNTILILYVSLFSSDAPLQDCSALKNTGFTTTGLYKIFPGDSEGEFTVFCDMDLLDGGWTIIQRRVDDSLNFDRKWDEYRNGFGYFDANFWLGLHKIKRITDMGTYELYIGMEDFDGSPSPDTECSRYSSFSLGSEASDYKLTIGGPDTSAPSNCNGGDSLSTHNTVPFSTPDKDNDPSESRHCAQLYKGGWWYKDCHDSNLNGVYYPTGDLPDPLLPDGIMWKSWLSEYKPLKTSVMAVRKL